MPADLVRRRLNLWIIPGVALTLLMSAAVAAQPALATDPPVITGLQYTRGGTHLRRTLVIHGTGLAKPTAVYFGEVAASFHKTSNGTRIQTESPSHPAGTVDVRVVTAAGESAIAAADQFTYIRPPKVTEVTPDRGHQRRPHTLTITGTRFHKVTEVDIGFQTLQQFTVTGPNELQVTVPPMSPGKWRVRVENKYGRWLGKNVYYTAVHDSPPSDWTVAQLPRPADRSRPWSIPAAMDCADVTDCAAVGFYRTATKHGSTVELDWSSNGAWSSVSAPLPDDQHFGGGRVEHVSCGSVGSCVGVGSYQGSGADYAGLIETLSGGTWTALRAPVPASVSPGTESGLNAVDCTSDDVCVAVGQAGNGAQQLFIDSNAGGTWDSQLAPLPSGVKGVIMHDAVSCGAPGSCVVVATLNNRGLETDIADTLSGGTWTSAVLPLPANAASPQPTVESLTGVTGVSCSSADFCAAVGMYKAHRQEPTGLLEVLHGTQWTATQATAPTESHRSNGVFIQVDEVSCAGEDTCLASGRMRKGIYAQAVPLTMVLSDTGWQTERVTTPKQGRHQTKDTAGNRAVACGASDTCLYASGFRRPGIQAPLLNDYTNGTWTSAEGPFPNRLGMKAQPAGAWCDSNASCVVVGAFYEVGPRESYRGYVQTRIND